MIEENSFFNAEILKTFIAESREFLQELEGLLINIEKGEDGSEVLNSMFRAIHTIKGSSGMFGFVRLEEFTHFIESLLDEVRSGNVAFDSGMISLLLDCKDHIEGFLQYIEDNGTDDVGETILAAGKILHEGLGAYWSPQNDMSGDDKSETDDEADEAAGPPVLENDFHVQNKFWHISLRFYGKSFLSALGSTSPIQGLNRIGTIKDLEPVPGVANLPDPEDCDPDVCYLGFEIDFQGEATKNEIEEIFANIRDHCDIRILPPESRISEYIKLITELPEEDSLIGDILIKVGSLTEQELKTALLIQENSRGLTRQAKPIGKIIVEEQMLQKTVVEEALKKQEPIRKKQNTMRVDSERIDDMINLVGELVIIGANVTQISEAEHIDRSNLKQSVSVMTRLIEGIRDNIMGMRMVPIGTTFKRFERIVRDLSLERNKEIDLVVSGGETELDKTLIEKITDPLMHLVRNSIDHGIDGPEERIAAGKSRRGKIHLNAYHETGNVIIEVIDDGEGLDRDRIFSKAVSAGMVNPDKTISDEELYQLIFQAGFSTAETVTNISGRGVGMDVVKKNIESLRGSIVLESEKGKGTSIRIHLPLTLSIIDGFQFKVGESHYVVPLEIVNECTEKRREELFTNDGGDYINLRGEVLPLLKLRDFFHLSGDEPDIVNVIVVRHRGSMAGLVVDSLVGEFQTVIKPPGAVFKDFKWISGITILGTGEVAVILDIPNLISSLERSRGDRKKVLGDR